MTSASFRSSSCGAQGAVGDRSAATRRAVNPSSATIQSSILPIPWKTLSPSPLPCYPLPCISIEFRSRQTSVFSPGRILPALFALFAPRVFHNSFPIKLFRTLSKNCRVYTNNSRSGIQPLQRISISFHFIVFPTVLRVFAFPQSATRFLSNSSKLLAKNTGGGQGHREASTSVTYIFPLITSFPLICDTLCPWEFCGGSHAGWEHTTT
jgi:hypothetical protein